MTIPETQNWMLRENPEGLAYWRTKAAQAKAQGRDPAAWLHFHLADAMCWIVYPNTQRDRELSAFVAEILSEGSAP